MSDSAAPKDRERRAFACRVERVLAHIGMLRVLRRERLRPGLVVGTSAMAIWRLFA